MIRKFVLLPLILFYMATLLMAGWQREIRPAWLNGENVMAVRLLERFGIRPGMAVFTGSRERMTELLAGRCPLVTSIDSSGRRKRIYPTEPCPFEGHRFKPAVYEHMIIHWSARLQSGDNTANLSALGDHFCQQANDPDIDRVLLELEKTMMDYRTGKKSKDLYFLGVVKCRN